MEWMSDPQSWIAFLTLTALEIVLGIDNIVFISILVGQAAGRAAGRGVPDRARARDGDAHPAAALSLSWIMGLTEPLLTIPLVVRNVSGRDLMLIVGGLFLIAKSTHGDPREARGRTRASSPRARRTPTRP